MEMPYLKRAFFGLRMSTRWSTHRWTISILTILRKMLVDDLYHRVYVFWDGNLSGKLRYDFYKPYKSDRENFINGTHPIDASNYLNVKYFGIY
jgi:hypothetical protein